MKTSLYIHIPFCSAKCRYCDFFSIPYKDKTEPAAWRILQKDLLAGILNELEIRLDELTPFKIETIFIGGGTPSAIDPEILDSFLSGLEKLLAELIDGETEFSMEANPESCSIEFLAVLRNHSVNRLSIGVQSFNTQTLEKIGRASFPDNVFETVSEIRSSWKRKLSLDIITGVTPDYLNDIQKAVTISPEHLSVYALTIEENTPLYEDLLHHRILSPDEELQAESITAAKAYLEDHGFLRYEISNYLRSDSATSNECSHNLMYWNMQSYIGVGPAAVSSFYFESKKTRVSNTEDVDRYISCFSRGNALPETCRSTEELNNFDFMLEHYLMGSRLAGGIDSGVFSSRFGHPPEYFIPETLERWRSSGLTGSGSCALNDDGMLLLNRFLSEVWDELKKNTFF